MKIAGIFEPGGLLASSLEDYEERPEQKKMAAAVASAIESGKHLIVEAGTGTGKTLAYLVPAVLSGKQAVISTGTRNLQEQVFFKDIPFLKKKLKSRFSAVMLKGRSNYLCPLRLEKFSRSPMLEGSADGKLLREIMEWSVITKTGDKSELGGMPEENRIWNSVCATHDFCSSQKCPRLTDCFIGRLRKEAENAQIIVVNHYLFFADLAIREMSFNRILPNYDVVIFDEAHQVEDVASQYFGFSVSNYRLEELVKDSYPVLKECGQNERKETAKDIDNLLSRSRNFFHSFRKDTDRRFSLKENELLKEPAEILLTSLEAIRAKLSVMKNISESSKALIQRYGLIHEELLEITSCLNDEYIFWGETRGNGVFLYASAIDVSSTFREALYPRCTAVFTSATLASAGGFDYFQSRLGLEEADTVLLPSPFDFSSQGTIYLPKMPPPNSNNFLDALASESIRLINLVKGRTLFLFTSFRNMHEIRRRLEGKIDYPILMQGEAPRHALLEQFKSRVDSILLATSSFWQGVDVRGEALSCVIIDRLPFASPGDPVISARIERIRRNGGNPFNDYQVPYAVLALKQGLGRLIRHRNDSGIIMVADSRMLSKGYGKVFLSSLPPAPRVYSFEDIEW